MERNIACLGRNDNVRVANARFEVVVSSGFGPRVLRYAERGGENAFAEIPPTEQSTPTPFGEPWHIYGGHRLWHAPEDPVRTYWPDNRPVHVAPLGDLGLVATQETEQSSLLQKQLEVTLDAHGSGVTVVHRIRNHGAFDVTLALWALTAMAPGGVAIFPNAPFAPYPERLLPVRRLVLWSYTDLSDPRWTFGRRAFLLRQDPTRSEPQKIGFSNEQGWMGYLRGRSLFVKRFTPAAGPHADEGCDTETFTGQAMLELESLGPLVHVAPGGAAVHLERWGLSTDGDDRVDADDLAERCARAAAELL